MASANDFVIQIKALDATAVGLAKSHKSVVDSIAGLRKDVAKTLAGLDKETDKSTKHTETGVGGLLSRLSGGFVNLQKKAAEAWHLKGLGKAHDRLKELKKTASETSDTFGRLITPLEGIAALGTVAGVGAMLTSFARGGMEIGRTSRTIGVSADALQRWRGIADLTGSSAESVTSALSNVGQGQYLAKAGMDPNFAATAKEFGLNINGSPNQFLGQVADALHTDPRLRNIQVARKLLSTLGIPEDMLDTLRRGSVALRKLGDATARHNYLNEIQRRQATELFQSYTGLTQSIQGFGNALAAQLEPQLKPVLDDMSTWLDNLKQQPGAMKNVQAGVEALGAAFGVTLVSGPTKAAWIMNRWWMSPAARFLFGKGAAAAAGAEAAAKSGAGDFAAIGGADAALVDILGGGIPAFLTALFWSHPANKGEKDTPGWTKYLRDHRPGAPSGGDPRGMIPVIKAAAAKYGIDPAVALRVARSEGLGTFSGDRGTSFGAFQLHVGGGLGDDFRKQTGLDPSNPANEAATIDFAMKNLARTGWSPYHGAARVGVGARQGIGVAGASVVSPVPSGPIDPRDPLNSLTGRPIFPPSVHYNSKGMPYNPDLTHLSRQTEKNIAQSMWAIKHTKWATPLDLGGTIAGGSRKPSGQRHQVLGPGGIDGPRYSLDDKDYDAWGKAYDAGNSDAWWKSYFARTNPATGPQSMNDTHHHVDVHLHNAPKGTRASIAKATGPADIGVRVHYGMDGLP